MKIEPKTYALSVAIAIILGAGVGYGVAQFSAIAKLKNTLDVKTKEYNENIKEVTLKYNESREIASRYKEQVKTMMAHQTRSAIKNTRELVSIERAKGDAMILRTKATAAAIQLAKMPKFKSLKTDENITTK